MQNIQSRDCPSNCKVTPWKVFYTLVSISWDLTDCADSWDIFVEDRNNTDNYFYKEVDAGVTLVLDTPDVTSCTEYEFQTTVIGGGKLGRHLARKQMEL